MLTFQCAKCGSRDVAVAFMQPQIGESTRELIACTCRRCGAKWKEEPLEVRPPRWWEFWK